MTMLDVFQDFIAFLGQPPPAFVGDTPILGFHMDGPGVTYNGFAVLRPSPATLHPFTLEGFGAASPTPQPVLQTMVRLSVQIGRFNPIESVLQFGDMASNGGFGNVLHEEDCDASASLSSTATPGVMNVTMTFANETFRATVGLFKTNLLRTL
jgi:hypothetical protein